MLNQAIHINRKQVFRPGGRLGALAVLLMLAFGLLAGGCFSRGHKGHGQAQLAAAAMAEEFVGVPYRYGGRDPKKGFDCSGLTWYVYQRQGLILPKTSRDQLKVGRKVKKSVLSPGDLVFFRNARSRRVDHVGIYVGQGRFVHAPGSGKKVERRHLDEKYYQSVYHSSRRVMN